MIISCAVQRRYDDTADGVVITPTVDLTIQIPHEDWVDIVGQVRQRMAEDVATPVTATFMRTLGFAAVIEEAATQGLDELTAAGS
jgi:hypothetical protein